MANIVTERLQQQTEEYLRSLPGIIQLQQPQPTPVYTPVYTPALTEDEAQFVDVAAGEIQSRGRGEHAYWQDAARTQQAKLIATGRVTPGRLRQLEEMARQQAFAKARADEVRQGYVAPRPPAIAPASTSPTGAELEEYLRWRVSEYMYAARGDVRRARWAESEADRLSYRLPVLTRMRLNRQAKEQAEQLLRIRR